MHDEHARQSLSVPEAVQGGPFYTPRHRSCHDRHGMRRRRQRTQCDSGRPVLRAESQRLSAVRRRAGGMRLIYAGCRAILEGDTGQEHGGEARRSSEWFDCSSGKYVVRYGGGRLCRTLSPSALSPQPISNSAARLLASAHCPEPPPYRQCASCDQSAASSCSLSHDGRRVECGVPASRAARRGRPGLEGGHARGRRSAHLSLQPPPTQTSAVTSQRLTAPLATSCFAAVSAAQSWTFTSRLRTT